MHTYLCEFISTSTGRGRAGHLARVVVGGDCVCVRVHRWRWGRGLWLWPTLVLVRTTLAPMLTVTLVLLLTTTLVLLTTTLVLLLTTTTHTHPCVNCGAVCGV
jgi:hypothetical protein